MDNRIELLEKRTVEILEKTKKKKEKYKDERKKLFDFSEEKSNLDAWENSLNELEKEIIYSYDFFFGAPSRTRTEGLLIKSQLLYQLS